MQSELCTLRAATLALAILTVVCLPLPAQEQERRVRVRIQEVEFKNMLSPLYQAQSDPRARRDDEWLQIMLKYESDARGGWADEIELEWNVVVTPKTGSKRPVLVKKVVTYVDVEDGEHHAVVYLRPTFIQRYYGAKRVSRGDIWIHVEAKADGAVADKHDYSRATNAPKNWWQATEPRVMIVDNALLSRDETPFAPLDYDFYEHIRKPQ